MALPLGTMLHTCAADSVMQRIIRKTIVSRVGEKFVYVVVVARCLL